MHYVSNATIIPNFIHVIVKAGSPTPVKNYIIWSEGPTCSVFPTKISCFVEFSLDSEAVV